MPSYNSLPGFSMMFYGSWLFPPIWVCLKMVYTPNYSHLKTG